MPQKCTTYSLFLIIALVSAALTSCSRKVRLSLTGTSLVSKPVDWQAVKSNATVYPKENKEAVEQWIDARKDGHKRTDFNLSTDAGEIPLTIDASKVPEFEQFDKIHLARAINVKNGLRIDIAHERGLGIPLVGRIPHTDKNNMIPKRGLWMPITAALVPGIDQAIIQIIDPTVSDKFPFSNTPASYDLTAPLALDIRNRQKDLQRLKALVNYDKFFPESGINRVFGFSANKTPVILVHGVFSSSTTWNNTINELLGDPVVRQNYEFWTYGYPTGAPIPYLSLRLREAVDEVVEYRKARGAHQKVILIGHSMGGLMSKAITQSTGHSIWDQLFTVSPNSLPIPDDQRQLWKNMFILEPIPEVSRVVFTATPHRGARGASSPPGKVIEKIIRLPENIELAVNNLNSNHSEYLTPLGKHLLSNFPNSIRHMQKDSEIGKIFEAISLNPNVRYHSYIGSTKGLEVPVEEMTDGIVERSSASITGVESERIYKSGHGVHTNWQTITDLKRVLGSLQ